jgi:hypothetical protein
MTTPTANRGVGWIVSGIALSLAALWVGAWALGQLHFEDWQSFPTFFTAFVSFFGGIGMVAYGAHERSFP